MARIIEVYDPEGVADAATLARAKRNLEGVRTGKTRCVLPQQQQGAPS